MRKYFSLSVLMALILGTISSADELDSLLALNLNELSNIKVAEAYGASKMKQSLVVAPANITIIKSDEIKSRHYRSIAEAVAAQSGFYLSYDRDEVYLGVRGFHAPGDYNSKILLLIDGHRTNENIYSSSTIAELNDIDMDMIDHVEVIRGSGSALYGSNAIFAVINIITKSAKEYKNGEVSLMAGNQGTNKERATLAHTFDNDANMLLSATRFNTNGNDDLYFKEFNNPATNNGHAQGIDSTKGYQLFLKSKIDNFTLEALTHNADKEVPTAPWETIFNKPVKGNNKHGYVQAGYTADLSSELSIKSTLAYNYYSFDGQYLYEDGGVTLSEDYAEASWLDGSIDLNYTQNTQLNWLFGLYAMKSLKERQTYMYDYVTYLDTNNQNDNYAAYIQAIYSPMKHLSVTLGARYDKYETIGSHISPKISAVYSFTKASSLKFIYGEAFRAPSSYELYYNDNDDTQKASPDLKEENIKNYEVVFEHYFATNHFFTINGFYYEMSNLVKQIIDPADGLLAFKNLSKSESKGVELDYHYMFENGIDTSINYTYQKTKDRESGKILVDSPKNLANAALTLPFLDKYSAVVSLAYVGKKINVYGDTIDGYTLANLSFNGYNVVKRLDLSASVYNLFNTTYYNPGGEEHIQKEIEQDGITVRVKAVYKF